MEQLRSGVQLACNPTYVPKIVQGRSQVSMLPRGWVLENIDRVAEEVLDLNDYWDYRRLLELLTLIDARESLQRFIATGLASADPDIREAAEDFSTRDSGRDSLSKGL